MKTYNESYHNTQEGILRSGAMFDTYDANFYIDNQMQIVGISCKQILDGELIGSKKGTKIELGAGNIVKGIIEDRNYENIEELFKELSVAYSFRIDKIMQDSNNINADEKNQEEQSLAA